MANLENMNNAELISVPLEELNNDTSSLYYILHKYKLHSLLLSKYASVVPASGEEMERLDEEEREVFEQQQDLLFKASNHRLGSLDEVKAMLDLWALENLDSRCDADFSPSDMMMKKVITYFRSSIFD